MARIRQILPSFFTDEVIGTLDPIDALAFVGLWTEADRSGRLEDRPVRLRARLFPYRPDLDVAAVLERLEAAGLITRYQGTALAEDGKPEGAPLALIEIRTFVKHQSPHPKEKTKYSAPAEADDPALGVAGGLVAEGSAHRGHAVCGRVCLPAFLCEQFVQALGGADAPMRVRSWAVSVLRLVDQSPEIIALAPVEWWRAQWRAYASLIAAAASDGAAEIARRDPLAALKRSGGER
jgi:hypothetical protein